MKRFQALCEAFGRDQMAAELSRRYFSGGWSPYHIQMIFTALGRMRGAFPSYHGPISYGPVGYGFVSSGAASYGSRPLGRGGYSLVQLPFSASARRGGSVVPAGARLGVVPRRD